MKKKEHEIRIVPSIQELNSACLFLFVIIGYYSWLFKSWSLFSINKIIWNHFTLQSIDYAVGVISWNI